VNSWSAWRKFYSGRSNLHLCVNNHSADEEVKDPAEGAEVVGHRTSNVGEHVGVVHDVHKHEREVKTLGVTVDREEHENNVVAEEGLGDQDVVPDAKQSGAYRTVSTEIT